MTNKSKATVRIFQNFDVKVEGYLDTSNAWQDMPQPCDDMSNQNSLFRLYQFLVDILKFGGDVAKVMFDIYVLKKQNLHVPNFAAFCIFHG